MKRWNAEDIIRFLYLYEKYPQLWNTKLKCYGNEKRRDRVFGYLARKIENDDLLGTGGIDLNELKYRIICLHTVYRDELLKIKKIAANGKYRYRSSLAWFKHALFLRKYLSLEGKGVESYVDDNGFNIFGEFKPYLKRYANAIDKAYRPVEIKKCCCGQNRKEIASKIVKTILLSNFYTPGVDNIDIKTGDNIPYELLGETYIIRDIIELVKQMEQKKLIFDDFKMIEDWK